MECRAGLTICVGVTPLAPNSLASALGLPLPDRAQDGTDTAGRGWRIQQQPLAGAWTVMIEPLGRFLTAAERRAFPDSSALVAAPARPAPSAGSSGAQTRRTDPSEGRGGAPAPIPAPARGQPGRTGAGQPAEQTPACTVVIDVRGLGHLQPDMTSFVFSGSRQLWPDAALFQGVSRQLVQETGLHTYISNEKDITRFHKVTRVKASRLRPSQFAPHSSVLTDVELGPNATREFLAAGKGCRVVYLHG